MLRACRSGSRSTSNVMAAMHLLCKLRVETGRTILLEPFLKPRSWIAAKTRAGYGKCMPTCIDSCIDSLVVVPMYVSSRLSRYRSAGPTPLSFQSFDLTLFMADTIEKMFCVSGQPFATDEHLVPLRIAACITCRTSQAGSVATTHMTPVLSKLLDLYVYQINPSES